MDESEESRVLSSPSRCLNPLSHNSVELLLIVIIVTSSPQYWHTDSSYLSVVGLSHLICWFWQRLRNLADRYAEVFAQLIKHICIGDVAFLVRDFRKRGAMNPCFF